MHWYRDEDTGVGACIGTEMKTQVFGPCSGTEMKTQVLVHAVVQR